MAHKEFIKNIKMSIEHTFWTEVFGEKGTNLWQLK